MSKLKLTSDIKMVLDSVEPPDNIKRQLQSRRVQILDQVESRGNMWSPKWSLPVTSMAIVLLAVVMMIPNGQNDFTEMVDLSAEDLEIMSTMDIEDIEDLEFYDWLDLQESLQG